MKLVHCRSASQRRQHHSCRMTVETMQRPGDHSPPADRSHRATLSALHASTLWPSLVHALSPPPGAFLLLVLLTCVPATLLADPVISSPSPAGDCLNASTLAVHLPESSTRESPSSLQQILLSGQSSTPPSRRNKLRGARRRQRRSSLFGRKRPLVYANYPGSKSSGNHTGPPPHYLESWPANPNYWITDRYHENVVCLLAQFSGIVRIRPSNSSFRGGTFSVSPEESLGRRANCERSSRNMFWKFSQADEREVANEDEDEYDVNLDGDEATANRKPESSVVSSSRGKSSKSARLVLVERSNRLLSAGFHVVGSVIEFHVAYIECLQQADKNVLNNRYRVYGDGVCVNLSVSFDLGSFGDRFAYECNYIWGKTLKDVHYNQNRRLYAGEVQISLKTVRIEKDPIGNPPYSFRKVRRRCAWDSVLSWQSLTITASLVVLFIVGFFGLCVCSNSNCSDETHPNWCCLCCRCCRRQRRAMPSRPLVERSQQTRLNHNHTGHSNYRSHAPPPPPPPAPPSSSMNSSRNQNTYSRKPTFSTTSYSYDGNGSNPTGQSSSAMSTALETDDESNGHHLALPGGGGQRVILATQHSPLAMCANGKQHLRAKLILRFISDPSRQMEWHLRAPPLAVLLRCHWLTSLPKVSARRSLAVESSIRQHRPAALDRPASPTCTTGPTPALAVKPAPLLYLYLLYWQLSCQLTIRRRSQPCPAAPRDLCPARQASKAATKLAPASPTYHRPSVGLPLLSSSL